MRARRVEVVEEGEEPGQVPGSEEGVVGGDEGEVEHRTQDGRTRYPSAPRSVWHGQSQPHSPHLPFPFTSRRRVSELSCCLASSILLFPNSSFPRRIRLPNPFHWARPPTLKTHRTVPFGIDGDVDRGIYHCEPTPFCMFGLDSTVLIRALACFWVEALKG